MAEKDKSALESVAAALRILPDTKREYLVGVANGMAAMAVAASEQSRTAESQDRA